MKITSLTGNQTHVIDVNTRHISIANLSGTLSITYNVRINGVNTGNATLKPLMSANFKRPTSSTEINVVATESFDIIESFEV
jgi:hypothetical protein